MIRAFLIAAAIVLGWGVGRALYIIGRNRLRDWYITRKLKQIFDEKEETSTEAKS